MISFQVAISLVLLSGAGLFIRSLVNLRGIDVGFRTDKLLQVTLNPSDYAPDRLPDFYNQMVEQVRSLPGVQAAAFGRQRLISNAAWKSGIVVPGFNPPEGDNGPSRDVIGSNYFSALGIPLIAGREFTDADTASAPKVAIVNQAFARFYFGSRHPLGMRIGPGGGKPDYTIVAVSRNAKYREMREATTRFWYVPFAQLGSDTSSFRALTLFVRTSSDPASMANSIRAAVGRVDKTIALFDIKTVDAQIGDNVRPGTGAGDPLDILRNGGGIACRHRSLWSPFILGGTAEAGDRHPDCTRRPPRSGGLGHRARRCPLRVGWRCRRDRRHTQSKFPYSAPPVWNSAE
jgi:hypothetical protein